MDDKPNVGTGKDNLKKNKQDVYLSPVSVNRKIADINTEFKKKMQFMDSNSNMVFDFTKGYYVKKESSICEHEKYKNNSSLLKNKNSPYEPKVMSRNGSNKEPEIKNYELNNNKSIKTNVDIPDGKVRNLIDTFNGKIKSPFVNSNKIDTTSILSSKNVKVKPSNIKSNIFSPINIMYTPKQPIFNPSSVPKASVNKPKQQTPEKKDSLFYGPGEKLVDPIKFSIHNTVYDFKDGKENTIYYIKISSNVTWMIRKTLGDIKSLFSHSASYIGHSYEPYDKNIRDKVIETILNNNFSDIASKKTCETDNKLNLNILQYFMLSGIVNDIVFRSSYLLMGDRTLLPFSFRLVGKALVCYDSNNRVFKIFLLEKCRVEKYEDISFILYSDTGSVKLYTSCKLERDQWMKDINDFIQNIK